MSEEAPKIKIDCEEQENTNEDVATATVEASLFTEQTSATTSVSASASASAPASSIVTDILNSNEVILYDEMRHSTLFPQYGSKEWNTQLVSRLLAKTFFASYASLHNLIVNHIYAPILVDHNDDNDNNKNDKDSPQQKTRRTPNMYYKISRSSKQTKDGQPLRGILYCGTKGGRKGENKKISYKDYVKNYDKDQQCNSTTSSSNNSKSCPFRIAFAYDAKKELHCIRVNSSCFEHNHEPDYCMTGGYAIAPGFRSPPLLPNSGGSTYHRKKRLKADPTTDTPTTLKTGGNEDNDADHTTTTMSSSSIVAYKAPANTPNSSSLTTSIASLCTPRQLPTTPTKRQLRKIGYLFDEQFLWHEPWGIKYSKYVQPYSHWDSPDTKRRIHNLVQVCGLMKKLHSIPLHHQTEPTYKQRGRRGVFVHEQDKHVQYSIQGIGGIEDVIALNHTRQYIYKVKETSARVEGGLVGEEVPISQHAFEIACMAVKGVIQAVDTVMAGGEREDNDEGEASSSSTSRFDSVYALVRPAGHHALSDSGMGFCIFNNVAIAAKYLLHRYSPFYDLRKNANTKIIQKIAIVDYDVHHGNGTQDTFYNDDRVLFISLHQDNNYPQNSGKVEETGAGKGNGTNINVPLPPGSGKGAYQYAFDQVVIPAITNFNPDFILVSSGFDASFQDSTAAMILSSDDFRYFAYRLMKVAKALCDGRIVFVHEGGYSEVYVPFCAVAVIEAMLGMERVECIEDPFLIEVNQWGGQLLQEHQKALIDQVVAMQKLL